MDRVEFMRQLECLLGDIPENDRLDAVAYYNDYFDEAGKENEASVIRELGNPEKVAMIIKADLNATGNERAEYTKHGDTKQKRKIPLVLFIVLIVFASPMILGTGLGIFGALIGVIAGLFGILIAIVACSIAFPIAGIVCFASGIFDMISNPAEGLLTMGVGALLTAVGLFLVVLCTQAVFKWLPKLFRMCVNGCQRISNVGKRRKKV